ncbi:hypothetical protein C8D88_103250 [Lentzea atacamensis]|uniref:Uncharacterized protein n=2 Tax=Lentzea TaxID=165301 RepID=A0A316I5P1_9PSEU|nr:hypothetical protein [Lentzea atacamensis]PWK88054.1 hypothetical protein C8D88_103250 [Lentzea atacamensis]RAS71225.1 hypothetical protein C8D87_1011526 [Lentzea atacamensis]
MDDEGVTGDELAEVPVAGTATVIDVTVGIGSTPGPAVEPTAATGAGSIAERIPNQDRPTATAVTTAQATRYPTDRLTATTLL